MLIETGWSGLPAERAVVQVARQQPEADFAEQLKASRKILSRV